MRTQRPLGPRLLGPRVSVAASAVFVAVCTVCAAFAVAGAAFTDCVPLGALLLLLFACAAVFHVCAAFAASFCFLFVPSVVCAFCCLCLLLFVLLYFAFSVDIVAASLCCFSCFVCCCFLLLFTLAALDLPKCQKQLNN